MDYYFTKFWIILKEKDFPQLPAYSIQVFEKQTSQKRFSRISINLATVIRFKDGMTNYL